MLTDDERGDPGAVRGHVLLELRVFGRTTDDAGPRQ